MKPLTLIAKPEIAVNLIGEETLINFLLLKICFTGSTGHTRTQRFCNNIMFSNRNRNERKISMTLKNKMKMKRLLSILLLVVFAANFAMGQFPDKVKTRVQFDDAKFLKSFIPPTDTFPITLADTNKVVIKGHVQFKVFNVGGVAKWDAISGGSGETIVNKIPAQISGTGAASLPLSVIGVQAYSSPAALRVAPGDGTTTYQLVVNNTLGTYRYHANDIASVDDSVMVIRKVGGGAFLKVIDKDYIDVREFGAVGDYATDDWWPITKAINYILTHANVPKRLYMPRGRYMISKPIFVYNWDGTHYQFVKFEIVGDGNAKIGLEGSGTSIACTPGMGNTFALGFQLGKGVTIRNINFIGLYTLPTTFTQNQIVRNTFAQWTQSGISDKKYGPHCAIAIDPFTCYVPADGGYSSMSSMYRGAAGDFGGSTDIHIENCRFWQFDVGIAVSPNGYTLNGEEINIDDCDFGYNKVCTAWGSTQSVGNTFRNFKVWAPVHTIIDGLNYGKGPGTAPNVIGGNIAAGNLAVYQFVNIASTTAAFSVKNLRSESMFKFGSVSPPNYFQGYAATCDNCVIHPLDPTQWPTIPTPDFWVQGKINFIGGDVEYTDPAVPIRLKLNNRFLDAHFDGVTLSPVIASRPGNPQEDQVTTFSGVTTWQYLHSLDKQAGRKGINTLYPGYLTQTAIGGDTKLKFSEGNGAVNWIFEWTNTTPDAIKYMGTATIVNNTTTGTCTITIPSAWTNYLRVGDALISDATKGWTLSDRNPDYNAINATAFPLSLWTDYAPTIGTITAIAGTTATVKGVGVNIPNGTTASVPIYLQWIREHNNPIAVTVSSGNAVLTNVENTEINAPIVFGSYVGQRLEHPGIPPGAFVRAVNPGAKTITMSDVALANYPHAQIINGYPKISATSNYDPAYAITNARCNLFEGAEWNEKRLGSVSEPFKYRKWLINRATFSKDLGAGYVPSALHPVSISRAFYLDDEKLDFPGHIKLYSTVTNSNITVGGGEIQSPGPGVLALTSNLYYSANFNSVWVYRNTGAGSVLHVSDNGLNYYTAPSGTAATAASLSHRFGIDLSGVPSFDALSGTGNRTVIASSTGALKASWGADLAEPSGAYSIPVNVGAVFYRGAAATITLPAVGSFVGRVIDIQNAGSASVALSPGILYRQGAPLMTTLDISINVRIISNGTNWLLIGTNKISFP